MLAKHREQRKGSKKRIKVSEVIDKFNKNANVLNVRDVMKQNVFPDAGDFANDILSQLNDVDDNHKHR